MSVNNSSRSGIFLMELMLSILFFSIAAAVCVELFAISHQLSNKGVNLNYAVATAESIAEAFSGCNGEESDWEILFPEAENCGSEGTQNIWKISDEEKGLTALAWIDTSKELRTCKIRVGTSEQITSYLETQQDFDSIYELEVQIFPKEELTDEKK